MAEESKEAALYTEADVQKLLQNVEEAMKQNVPATGFNIATTTLETFAQSILDATIETNSDAAQQGAEAMRGKIVSSALKTARDLRDKAEAQE